MEKTKVELLSPAGDMECFIAAVNAGADAVYLGLKRFGARAGARNFTQEELKRALDIAHIFDSKIYLTVNTLFKDEEMEDLYDLLHDPYINGLHGVIVQDTGVMSYIAEQFPLLPIHVSTQAGITSSDGAKYLSGLGVSRIVPARELGLTEIRKLKKESGLEIECFIHGSMCYSYSGKCLLSSFIGGRSGNRGRCAQPCRLLYDSSYPLSMKDMCTIDIIPELIDAGISSFKIEGRMKSASYVYGVTSIYRKYIDCYLRGERYEVSGEDRDRLISLYTRSGNCGGYYFTHNDKEMITPDSPSYQSSADVVCESDVIMPPVMDVSISCSIRENEPALISVYNDRYRVDVTTGVFAQKAQNRPLTRDDVTGQLCKCGGTTFTITNIDLTLDGNVFLPKSAVNEIRRSGLDAFKDEILSKHLRSDITRSAVLHRDHTEQDRSEEGTTSPEVNVSVLTEEQLGIALACSAGRITIPMHLYERVCKESRFDPGNRKIFIALPYIIREEEKSAGRSRITDLVGRIRGSRSVAGFYVSNHESVNILRDAGNDGIMAGDIHMYAYNSRAYDFYRDNGIDIMTVPVELNKHELRKRGIRGEELIIYGRIPVMVSANCIRKTQTQCNRKSEGNTLHITDRKGEKLFVMCECNGCTNTIYNSAVLSISDEKDLFDILRPSSVRLSFTDESPVEMKRILDTYFANRTASGATGVKLTDRYTKGHIKRGVD
ncbi:MAG: U32 family peptidase [Lachnospiraceae bacterium]|nr:U32 family peptidase [Lachnospiraceae bacterium]